MKGIKQYFKDIIEKYKLNPPSEVNKFVYSSELRKEYFQVELENVISIIYKLWDKEISYFDVINKGGTNDVVLARSYFSRLMRMRKKNKKHLFSFEKIGLFFDKKPHTIMHYCTKIERDYKEMHLFNIFYKHYKKMKNEN